MVKLTADLILQAEQYLNTVKDREIDLRGYKIPIIENLGVTLDQFDTIDLSDNEIRKLDGFPLLKRLKNLLVNNNRVCRIGENLQDSLPNLESIVLTNNHIQELGDIDPLATVKKLTSLSLLKNPVASKTHYRLYVINKIPQLRLLDFRKIKQREREDAATMFKGKKGKQLEKQIGKRTKTFTPGAPVSGGSGGGDHSGSGPSPSDVKAIKEAITNAKTLEEVERLNFMLRAGQIPGKDGKQKNSAQEGEEEMDEDDNTSS